MMLSDKIKLLKKLHGFKAAFIFEGKIYELMDDFKLIHGLTHEQALEEIKEVFKQEGIILFDEEGREL